MKKAVLSIVLAVLAITAVSQELIRGPHGGSVAIIGEYRLEALGCDEYLEIYLYDKYMSPMLNYGSGGDVQFFKSDNVSTSEKLVLYGTDGFTAHFPEYYFQQFKVNIKVNGVIYTARFKNECVVSY